MDKGRISDLCSNIISSVLPGIPDKCAVMWKQNKHPERVGLSEWDEIRAEHSKYSTVIRALGVLLAAEPTGITWLSQAALAFDILTTRISKKQNLLRRREALKWPNKMGQDAFNNQRLMGLFSFGYTESHGQSFVWNQTLKSCSSAGCFSCHQRQLPSVTYVLRHFIFLTVCAYVYRVNTKEFQQRNTLHAPSCMCYGQGTPTTHWWHTQIHKGFIPQLACSQRLLWFMSFEYASWYNAIAQSIFLFPVLNLHQSYWS